MLQRGPGRDARNDDVRPYRMSGRPRRFNEVRAVVPGRTMQQAEADARNLMLQ